jgi:hypothetical protein
MSSSLQKFDSLEKLGKNRVDPEKDSISQQKRENRPNLRQSAAAKFGQVRPTEL